MTERAHDPRRLSLRSLAGEAAALQGEMALQDLPRLQSSVLAPPADAPRAAVSWAAQGQLRPSPGGEPEIWLHLRARAEVVLQCQRCLQAMGQRLDVERAFRFVADPQQADRLDEELDDDVLALPKEFDLLALVEDELILALPLVPRHEVCPQPLPHANADAQPEAKANPFAALAALRRTPPRAE